jgi:hypothetical protein
VDLAATGYAAGTHSAGNNGCVRGHTASDGQNTLARLHTGDVLGRGLKSYKNYLLAASIPSLCILCSEFDLTDSSSIYSLSPAASPIWHIGDTT